MTNGSGNFGGEMVQMMDHRHTVREDCCGQPGMTSPVLLGWSVSTKTNGANIFHHNKNSELLWSVSVYARRLVCLFSVWVASLLAGSMADFLVALLTAWLIVECLIDKLADSLGY